MVILTVKRWLPGEIKATCFFPFFPPKVVGGKEKGREGRSEREERGGGGTFLVTLS